ncbi:reverse transcriptase family protein [Agromyces soli]
MENACPRMPRGFSIHSVRSPSGRKVSPVIPPNLYHEIGRGLGVEVDALDRATAEVARLTAQGAYPILSLAHLAHETGASYSYLREVVSRTRDPYRSIAVPKATGGVRPISAPEPILMDVQRWLLGHVLDKLTAHPASYAYRREVSIVQCATQHQGARWMVKMDLHDFFGTVNEASVYRVFRRLGYRKLLAFELARITTRAEGAHSASWRARTAAIPNYAVAGVGVLPQGGPTSGMLANAAAARLDVFLQSLALSRRLTYTRYSDDLVFSGRSTFQRSEAQSLAAEATGLIRKAGFVVHRAKTRIVPPGARKVVLGLLVDGSVRLLPEHRRRIEVHLRGCEENGLARHAAHRGFDSVFSFINHLDGWIAFALGVERERAMDWRLRFHGILEHEGLPKLGG